MALKAHRCDDYASALDAYVDRELDASRQVSLEQHLSVCKDCSRHVDFSRRVKSNLKSALAPAKASDALRARIVRSAHKDTARASWVRRAAYAGGALAAASGVVWALTFAHSHGPTSPRAVQAEASVTDPTDALLEELASLHARPLPPEETDPLRVSRKFSPIVGVPVRPLALPDQQGYTFAGGRLLPLNHQDPAAFLTYEHPSRGRLTVFVFDSHRIEISRWCCLRPTKIHIHSVAPHSAEQVVYVARSHGYPLAVSEGSGVGYVVSGDTNDTEVALMAAEMPGRAMGE